MALEMYPRQESGMRQFSFANNNVGQHANVLPVCCLKIAQILLDTMLLLYLLAQTSRIDSSSASGKVRIRSIVASYMPRSIDFC